MLGLIAAPEVGRDSLRLHPTQPMPRAALDGHVPPPSKGIFLIVESPTIEIDNQEISRRQN